MYLTKHVFSRLHQLMYIVLLFHFLCGLVWSPIGRVADHVSGDRRLDLLDFDLHGPQSQISARGKNEKK
jgi:hypothetical protein